jgi:hypothetical protein
MSSTNYLLSRDYTELVRLMREGQTVVCFIDFNFDSLRNTTPPCRDICKTRYENYEGRETFSLNARGIGYIEGYDNERGSAESKFIAACEKSNVEFLPPSTTSKHEEDLSLQRRLTYAESNLELLAKHIQKDGMTWSHVISEAVRRIDAKEHPKTTHEELDRGWDEILHALDVPNPDSTNPPSSPRTSLLILLSFILGATLSAAGIWISMH